jgi:hypothetical protein
MRQPPGAARREPVPEPLELSWRGRADRQIASPATPNPDAPASVVASFPDYAAAEQAVDLLVARGFPVEHLRIAGEDLRLVEDVTGPLTYGLAAFRGLLAGVCFGIFVGLLFGVLSLTDPLVSAVTLAAWGALIGGGAGVLVATLGHWLAEGRRDFMSRTTVEAARFTLLCEGDRAEEATGLVAPQT